MTTTTDPWADELARKAAAEAEVAETANDDAADSTADEAPITDLADLANLPWSFNPPMHPSLRHVNPDLLWAYEEGSEDSNTFGSTTDFAPLRLGRIYMGKHAMSFAAQEQGTRYGFRFLYNPSEVSGGMETNANFIVNPSVTMASIIQEGLEAITIETMINRMPEVQGQASISDYHPAITAEDLEKLRKYGTHWDLEYLYRVCNGLHQTRSNDEWTGDIGILLPNPSRFQLGPFLSNGAVEMIQADDLMFSADMVPMLTKVTIMWRRYLMMSGSTIADLKKSEDTTTADDPGGTGGGNGPDAPPSSGTTPGGATPAGTQLTGAQVEKLAKDAGFGGDSKLATQIAWAESGWRTGSHNPNASTGDNSYGLWQINMLGSLGPDRRKRYGLPNNEVLYDAATNAYAAHRVYLDSGSSFSPWTTYTSGKYKKAPAW